MKSLLIETAERATSYLEVLEVAPAWRQPQKICNVSPC